MKKTSIILLGISLSYAQPAITSDMMFDGILDGIIDTIKGIPQSISHLGNSIYNREVKKEKSYWWYFNRNSKLKVALKKRKIDYYTILKQGMYPLKVYDNSRKAEMKKYAILLALAKENEITTEESTQGDVPKEHRKKKLDIQITDMNDIKKN